MRVKLVVLEPAEVLLASAPVGPCAFESRIFASHHHHRLPATSIGTTTTAAAMPRSLARLRYKPPLKPITFANGARRSVPQLDDFTQRRVAAYVVRQSNPKHLRLQTVVNEKARRQATGKRVTAPIKPYTLRDVVDPEGTAEHGEIIYIFRNTKTNQIIYSLQELLDVWHRLCFRSLPTDRT
jgi:hypothetical protein